MSDTRAGERDNPQAGAGYTEVVLPLTAAPTPPSVASVTDEVPAHDAVAAAPMEIVPSPDHADAVMNRAAVKELFQMIGAMLFVGGLFLIGLQAARDSGAWPY